MARTVGKLSALQVGRLTEPGRYSDGGGLYLQVTARENAPPAKSWIFRYSLNKQAHEMGLGPLHAVGLAAARAKAAEYRGLCQAGHDPMAAREEAKAQASLDAAKVITFRECSRQYIASHRAAWRNAKHASQWEATLETYVYPKLGSLPPQAIDTGLVLSVIEPIWNTKTETANRVRGRIEAVLDWARVRGYCDGENPARWRGHLDNLLPKPSKVHKVVHHAALPYSELPAFMQKLRRQEGIAARALEFAILTAARTGEVIGARKRELGLEQALWTVPAERMKAGVEHRVPLSPRAADVAREMMEIDEGDYLFPGAMQGKPLSNMAMTAVLRRMGYGHVTVHGFRSTFRDFVAEQTAYPGEVAEAALAHANGDKVEAAYFRADLFEKRRRLMGDWAEYCGATDRPVGEVVPIRAVVH